ncbi:hypothetical protein [Actinocorallia sp. A-T 12471]|nr:hypothetical protein [Actinocorallia sp. A-T 12471]MDX6742836.1 hypothetical protein [Actinocorallia sp. A-T 12471]
MASLVSRIQRLLHSPKGRQARSRVERLARDPRTQAKVRTLLSRRPRRRY